MIALWTASDAFRSGFTFGAWGLGFVCAVALIFLVLIVLSKFGGWMLGKSRK